MVFAPVELEGVSHPDEQDLIGQPKCFCRGSRPHLPRHDGGSRCVLSFEPGQHDRPGVLRAQACAKRASRRTGPAPPADPGLDVEPLPLVRLRKDTLWHLALAFQRRRLFQGFPIRAPTCLMVRYSGIIGILRTQASRSDWRRGSCGSRGGTAGPTQTAQSGEVVGCDAEVFRSFAVVIHRRVFSVGT